jgi:hypothetical protein
LGDSGIAKSVLTFQRDQQADARAVAKFQAVVLAGDLARGEVGQQEQRSRSLAFNSLAPQLFSLQRQVKGLRCRFDLSFDYAGDLYGFVEGDRSLLQHLSDLFRAGRAGVDQRQNYSRKEKGKDD